MQRYFSLVMLISTLTSCFGLYPHRFPDGRLVRFIPNIESPRDDLIHLEPRKVTIVTTNWLQIIIIDANRRNVPKININENYLPLLEYFNVKDNLHTVNNINNLTKMLQDKSYNDDINLFLGWYPKGEHGRNEILYIIICKLLMKEKQLNVETLIQSPFWDPRAIKTKYLKNALLDLDYIADKQKMDISLEKLYERDFRYKLEWSTWFLENDIN